MAARYRDARARDHDGSALNARLSDIRSYYDALTLHLSRQQLLQLPIAAPPAELDDAKVEVLESGSGLPAEEDEDEMSDSGRRGSPTSCSVRGSRIPCCCPGRCARREDAQMQGEDAQGHAREETEI